MMPEQLRHLSNHDPSFSMPSQRSLMPTSVHKSKQHPEVHCSWQNAACLPTPSILGIVEKHMLLDTAYTVGGQQLQEVFYDIGTL